MERVPMAALAKIGAIDVPKYGDSHKNEWAHLYVFPHAPQR